MPLANRARLTLAAGLTVHGAQLSARARRPKAKPAVAQRESLLFSHRGVTGPAALDLSHYAVMAIERGTPLPGAEEITSKSCPTVGLYFFVDRLCFSKSVFGLTSRSSSTQCHQ